MDPQHRAGPDRSSGEAARPSATGPASQAAANRLANLHGKTKPSNQATENIRPGVTQQQAGPGAHQRPTQQGLHGSQGGSKPAGSMFAGHSAPSQAHAAQKPGMPAAHHLQHSSQPPLSQKQQNVDGPMQQLLNSQGMPASFQAAQQTLGMQQHTGRPVSAGVTPVASTQQTQYHQQQQHDPNSMMVSPAQVVINATQNGAQANEDRRLSTSYNPMYGMEAVSQSPASAMKSKQYTPILTPQLAAARVRSSAAEPRPQILHTGDLFMSEQERPQQSIPESAEPELQSLMSGLPSWNISRPSLTGEDLVAAAAARQRQAVTSGGQGDVNDLEGLPQAAQETKVMHDLLFAFMGVDGRYVHATLVDTPTASGGVKASGKTLTFVLQASLQPPSQEMIEKLLPICEYVAILRRFVETRSRMGCGLVNQSVCSVLRSLLGDWYLVVTQLEHQLRTGKLTLPGLLFYCQGPMSSLGLLASIAAEAAAEHLRGAGLINLLTAKASSHAGNAAARTLLQKLIHAAAKPYCKILEQWLSEGTLKDTYDEFIVQENKAVDTTAIGPGGRIAYWDTKYTLRRNKSSSHTTAAAGGATTSRSPSKPSAVSPEDVDMPTFLQPVMHEILDTGKCLNAIRECGQAVPKPIVTNRTANAVNAGRLLAWDPSQGYISTIHQLHTSASAALLKLLLQQQDLLGWLRSIKHFFLTDQGDVVLGLSDCAATELGGGAEQLSKPRLQSLLEMTVRTSSLAQDPHVESLQLEFEPRSVLEATQQLLDLRDKGIIHDQQQQQTLGSPASLLLSQQGRAAVKGWQVLQLNLQLKWPLTLVVPPVAMKHYQIIFRHLFQLRHIEGRLSLVWHRMQASNKAKKADRDALKPAYQLSHRLRFFIQEVLRYSTTDVLEPVWRAMEEACRKATDVDKVIACHDRFLHQALDGLLLSNPGLAQTIFTLLQTCLEFSDRSNQVWDKTEAYEQAVRKQQQQQVEAEAQAKRASNTGRPSNTGGAAQKLPSSGSQRFSSGALRVPAEVSVQLPPPPPPLEILDVARDFKKGLSELLSGLRSLYDEAMNRETAGPAQQALGTREEVEALQNLIQRLDMDAKPSTATQAAAGGQQQGGVTGAVSSQPFSGSMAAVHQRLSAEAAALNHNPFA